MRLICSPSRSTTRRSTPCVDGWWGPKLTVSSSPPKAPCSPVLVTVTPGDSITPSRFLWRRLPELVLLGELDDLAAHRVVAAQGVSDPVVRHEDSGQPRVACEDDAEHVVRLPLLPVGGREEVVHGIDVGRVGGDECPHAQV